MKHGEGKFCWHDGRSYSGYWQDGRRHGRGACASAEGNVQLSEWQADRLIRWLPDAKHAEDIFVKQNGCLLGQDIKTGLSSEVAKEFVKQTPSAVGFVFRTDSPDNCSVKATGARFEAGEEACAWTSVVRLKLSSELAEKLVRSWPHQSLSATKDMHGSLVWDALSWVDRWTLLAPKEILPDSVKEVAREEARKAIRSLAEAAHANAEPEPEDQVSTNLPSYSDTQDDSVRDASQKISFEKLARESSRKMLSSLYHSVTLKLDSDHREDAKVSESSHRNTLQDELSSSLAAQNSRIPFNCLPSVATWMYVQSRRSRVVPIF